MDELKIEMKPVKSIPKAAKKGKQGSKYDPILQQFLDGTNNIVELSFKGVDSDKLTSGLRQRIIHNTAFSGVSVVTRVMEGKTLVFLEKKKK